MSDEIEETEFNPIPVSDGMAITCIEGTIRVYDAEETDEDEFIVELDRVKLEAVLATI